MVLRKGFYVKKRLLAILLCLCLLLCGCGNKEKSAVWYETALRLAVKDAAQLWNDAAYWRMMNTPEEILAYITAHGALNSQAPVFGYIIRGEYDEAHLRQMAAENGVALTDEQVRMIQEAAVSSLPAMLAGSIGEDALAATNVSRYTMYMDNCSSFEPCTIIANFGDICVCATFSYNADKDIGMITVSPGVDMLFGALYGNEGELIAGMREEGMHITIETFGDAQLAARMYGREEDGK